MGAEKIIFILIIKIFLWIKIFLTGFIFFVVDVDQLCGGNNIDEFF